MAVVATIVLAVATTAAPARAGTIVYTFSACIDGRGLLLIQGDTLQWQLVSDIPVGIPTADCPENPTIISTSLNGQKVIDKFRWFPVFDYPAAAGALSSVLSGLRPPLPSSDMQVTAKIIQARDSAGVQQLPTAENAYTLILNFEDDVSLGEGLYIIEVTITAP